MALLEEMERSIADRWVKGAGGSSDSCAPSDECGHGENDRDGNHGGASRRDSHWAAGPKLYQETDK